MKAMKGPNTTIKVQSSTVSKLKKYGQYGDSLNDIILRLIEFREGVPKGG